jgi:hypothetical protein
MKRQSIKASKNSQKKPKVIEWEERKNARGTRFIPVDVTRRASTTRQTRIKTRGKLRGQDTGTIENNEATLHESTPASMDIDETPWMEGPAAPEKKRRVSKPALFSSMVSDISQSERTYIDDFIPKIGLYLRCILNHEGVAAMTMCQSCLSAPFEWRCTDCFPALVLCKDCCRRSHQRLPFHRIQKWTGKYFIPSWLREVGVGLSLGHSGDLCPTQSVCQRASYIFNPTLKRYSSKLDKMKMRKIKKPATAICRMNMQQLPIFSSASAAQILDVTTKMEIL